MKATTQNQLMPKEVAPFDPSLEHVSSFSGGKDSTAKIVGMLEKGMRLDRVVFAQTGFEFQEIYDHINWMDNWLIKYGLHVEFADRKTLQRAMRKTLWLNEDGQEQTILPGELDPRGFDDWFMGILAKGHKKGERRGWPRTGRRKGGTQGCWWMRESKYKPLQQVIGDNYTYIGFASDEKGRTMKALARPVYPLKDWGWTEAYCLKYLDKNGISKPIHHKFNRTGCFLCPYQSTESLRVIYESYPEEWKIIRTYDELSPHEMKPDLDLDSIEDNKNISSKVTGCDERWF